MRIVALLVLAGVLSACATTGPKVQQLDSTKTVSFTYATAVPQRTALKLVADGLLAQSRLKLSIGWSSGYRKIGYRQNQAGLEILYIHANRDGNRMAQTVTAVTVPVTIKTDNNQTTITVAEPTTANEDTGHTLLFIPVAPYDALDKVVGNTRYMVNHLKPAAFKQSVSKNDEIVSKFNSNSIRANFKRLASCVVSGGSNRSCTINNVNCDIKVFDYRNGSKIITTLSTKKSFYPDGSSDSSAVEQQLAGADKKIRAIIAD
jgi:hypothetical protein